MISREKPVLIYKRWKVKKKRENLAKQKQQLKKEEQKFERAQKNEVLGSNNRNEQTKLSAQNNQINCRFAKTFLPLRQFVYLVICC